MTTGQFVQLPSNTGKMLPTFPVLSAPLSIITASEPCSLDVKCKPLAAACDIAVNHKLFVCILLGKSLSLISVWHRNCYVGIDAHISRMLRLTFELTQNKSQQFTNKLLICFSVIPRSAAEDNWTQSHAQSHTRLPVADLVLTLLSPPCRDLYSTCWTGKSTSLQLPPQQTS